MRALIEMSDYPAELFQHNYAPVQNPDTIVAQYLGAGGKTTTIPAKILFDDFRLTPEWKTLFDQKKTDFFEDKSENSVPRFGQGNANPRHIERVPAGVIFEGKITLIPHERGDIDCSLNALREFLERGIALLEENYIG